MAFSPAAEPALARAEGTTSLSHASRLSARDWAISVTCGGTRASRWANSASSRSSIGVWRYETHTSLSHSRTFWMGWGFSGSSPSRTMPRPWHTRVVSRTITICPVRSESWKA